LKYIVPAGRLKSAAARLLLNSGSRSKLLVIKQLMGRYTGAYSHLATVEKDRSLCAARCPHLLTVPPRENNGVSLAEKFVSSYNA
jgi:hypothetical protein